ncbi:MAG: hypothetical protein AB2704_26040 [Candidatus Thiodiazotropha taylori]
MKQIVLMIFLIVLSSASIADGDTQIMPTSNNDLISTWGLGVGLAAEFYQDEYIKTASIHGDTSRVVVEESFDSQPSFWAVGNWTVDDCTALWSWVKYISCSSWRKPGFFVGAKLADEDGVNLSGISLGIQLAFLQNVKLLDDNNKIAVKKKPSWNLGLGWVNHKTRTFASSINEGSDLPEEYDDIVYKEGRGNGWIIMISKNIN